MILWPFSNCYYYLKTMSLGCDDLGIAISPKELILVYFCEVLKMYSVLKSFVEAVCYY